MPQSIEVHTFAGPHPTYRDFVDRLGAWGFAKRKDEGVHTVYRGPHGGTLRVLRSQMGRVDPAQAAKAARLIGVTPSQFWAGPAAEASAEEAAGPSANPQPITPTMPGHAETDHLQDVASVFDPLADPVVELFGRLFPAGVQMTADLLSDLQDWTRLTSKLARHATSSPSVREGVN